MTKRRLSPHLRGDPSALARSEADALWAAGNIDDALKAFEDLWKSNPKDVKSALALAALHEDKKQFKKALDVLDQASEISPKNPTVLLKLGGLSLKTGNYSRAVDFATQSLELMPQSADAHALFGTVMQHRGNLPLAIEHLQQALRIQLKKPLSPAPKTKKPSNGNFNTPEIESLLWDTLAMLAEGGVHAFASHGTLLGLVREGGLLPFDKDIDIGIPFSESARAKSLLLKNGWRQQTGNYGLINPISFLHASTKITLDLCGFSVEKDSGKTIYGFWMEGIPKEWNRIIELEKLTLEKVTCPSGRPIWQVTDPEVIFIPFYGNWKVPDKEFEGIIGEPGLRGASMLTQCYGLSRIFNSLAAGKKRRAAKQAFIMQCHLPHDPIYRQILKSLA